MKIIDLEKRQGDFQMKTGSFSMEEGKIHGIIGGSRNLSGLWANPAAERRRSAS